MFPCLEFGNLEPRRLWVRYSAVFAKGVLHHAWSPDGDDCICGLCLGRDSSAMHGPYTYVLPASRHRAWRDQRSVMLVDAGTVLVEIHEGK